MTTITPSARPRRRAQKGGLSQGLRQAMPYLICIGGFLVVWQALSLVLGVGRLPGPLNVVLETWDPYISQPFFDDGGTVRSTWITGSRPLPMKRFRPSRPPMAMPTTAARP